MAGKVIDELITKWVYKVDTRQVKKALRAVQQFKSQLRSVTQNVNVSRSISQVDRLSNEWADAARSVRAYREEMRKLRHVGPGGSRPGGGPVGTPGSRGGGRRTRFLPFPGTVGSIATGVGVYSAFNAFARAFRGGLERETQKLLIEQFAGDTGKAQAFIQELEEFAIKTPFKLNELQSFSGMLLALGVDLNKVLPILQAFGEHIALFPNIDDNMFRLILNFAQLMQTGGLNRQQEKENLRRFTDVADTAASLLFPGLPVVEAKKRFAAAREAKVETFSPELFLQALLLQAGIGKTPEGVTVAKSVAGNIALRMQGAPGAVADLGDQSIITATKMAEQLNPAIEKLSDTITTFLQENEKGMIESASSFNLILTSLTDILGSASKLMGSFIDIGTLRLRQLGLTFGDPAGDSGSIVDRTKVLTDAFNNWTEALKDILSTMSGNEANERLNNYLENRWQRFLNPNFPFSPDLNPSELPSGFKSSSVGSIRFIQTNNIQLAEGQSVEDALSDISQSARLLTTDYLGSVFFV